MEMLETGGSVFIIMGLMRVIDYLIERNKSDDKKNKKNKSENENDENGKTPLTEKKFVKLFAELYQLAHEKENPKALTEEQHIRNMTDLKKDIALEYKPTMDMIRKSIEDNTKTLSEIKGVSYDILGALKKK
jgi:hypothetical protein